MRIYWLWGLTERADLADWRPRRFWRWLGRWQDRAHGYYAGMSAVVGEGVSQAPSNDRENIPAWTPSVERRIEDVMRREFPPAWLPGPSEDDSEEVWKPTLTDIRRAAKSIAAIIAND